MIRKIITSDFPIVYKLGEEINENYSHVNNLTSIINDNNKIIYFYIINNAVVGFIHLTVSFDEADIVDIITDKKYRRRNIGTSLIKYVINDNNLKKMNLEVRENNQGAIDFYENLQFKKVRRIKNYYGTEDAIFMVKEI